MNTSDLLRAVAVPRKNICIPPKSGPEPSFYKRFDVSGNFAVDDTALIAEMVPTSIGAVIWYPHFGSNAIFRYGIVPLGTQSLSAGTFLFTQQQASYLQYNSPTMVPYGSEISSDVLTISPEITSSTFSMSRIIAGSVKMVSDSVPIGNVSLNGLMAASAIFDIRDVLQVGYVNFTPAPNCLTLDVSTMSQCAVTSKDSVKLVNGQDGVTVLLGPDVPPKMMPPDMTLNDIVAGGPVQTYLFTGQVPVAAQQTLTASGLTDYMNQYGCWISPWNTTLIEAGGNYPYNNPNQTTNFVMQQINYGPIDAFSVLDLHISIQVYMNSAQPVGYQEQWFLYAIHVFATCSSTGAVNYSYIVDTYNLVQSTNGGAGELDFTADITPKPYQIQYDGVNDGIETSLAGIFMGTQIYIWNQNQGTVDGTGPCSNIAWGNIQVRPRNLYAMGAIGPCRILKYDSFTKGQQIRVDGMYYVETIPGGTTAPFTQEAAMHAPICDDSDALTVIARLYNGPSKYRRVFTNSGYAAFVKSMEMDEDEDNDKLFREPKRIRY